MLSSFPHLTNTEFDKACTNLQEEFQPRIRLQNEYISVQLKHQNAIKYLRFTKALPFTVTSTASTDDHDPNELEEQDDEALHLPINTQPLINYDIFLSPTYQVPVLYASISDTLHRFPPTMSTLYEHLIPPQFKAQTDSMGVIGGITVTDHPATNRPVFFIHPCQTAEVMKASVARRAITGEEYLMVWIGSLGKFLGFDIPLAFIKE